MGQTDQDKDKKINNINLDIIKKKIEELKTKLLKYYDTRKNKPLFILNIVMAAMLLLIIILISQFNFIGHKEKEVKAEIENVAAVDEEYTEDLPEYLSSPSEIEEYGDESTFVKCEDDRVYHFVLDFFKAKKYLDFVNIYRSFNRDYVTMVEAKEGREYENEILYEHNLVKDYKDLEVYKTLGKKQNEYVLICKYNILTYYTEEVAPTIIVAYIVDDGNKIYFKDNLDIGESKYITKVLEEKKVKDMYNEVKKNLTRNLANDANLKLVYNSLRQYDMNENNFLLDDKDKIVARLFGGANNKEKEYMDLARKKMEANNNSQTVETSEEVIEVDEDANK